MRNKKKQPETTSAYEKVFDALSLPKSAAGLTTTVTITGTNAILVEGYRGIIKYSDTLILLNAPKYIIRITGADLEITEIASEYISLRGVVASLEYTH
ncbi:MAG: YabP/YqfC family sporulation protein [Clostridia bacterium]|nr:YabP/YqfC family sporulation protein [Clostridia bacterium]